MKIHAIHPRFKTLCRADFKNSFLWSYVSSRILFCEVMSVLFSLICSGLGRGKFTIIVFFPFLSIFFFFFPEAVLHHRHHLISSSTYRSRIWHVSFHLREDISSKCSFQFMVKNGCWDDSKNFKVNCKWTFKIWFGKDAACSVCYSVIVSSWLKRWSAVLQ